MSDSLRMQLLGIAGAAVLAVGAAGTASAVPGSIPGASGGNDGLHFVYDDISAGGSRAGWFGENLYLIGTADIEVRYHGSEASFLNSFFWGDDLLEQHAGGNDFGAWSANGSVIGSYSGVIGGPLNFGFGIDSATKTLLNGANGANNPTTPNFFISFGGTGSSSAAPNPGGGQIAFLWLDDGAGGTTDNHDDMVISLRITGDTGTFAIPLPAAVWLMIAGIGGLGLVARRRKATEA